MPYTSVGKVHVPVGWSYILLLYFEIHVSRLIEFPLNCAEKTKEFLIKTREAKSASVTFYNSAEAFVNGFLLFSSKQRNLFRLIALWRIITSKFIHGV